MSSSEQPGWKDILNWLSSKSRPEVPKRNTCEVCGKHSKKLATIFGLSTKSRVTHCGCDRKKATILFDQRRAKERQVPDSLGEVVDDPWIDIGGEG